MVSTTPETIKEPRRDSPHHLSRIPPERGPERTREDQRGASFQPDTGLLISGRFTEGGRRVAGIEGFF